MAPQGIHISLVGAIPKTHKPGHYQLIMDLLSLVRRAILDIKEAYQMVPIHLQDQQLIGVQ